MIYNSLTNTFIESQELNLLLLNLYKVFSALLIYKNIYFTMHLVTGNYSF